MRRGRGAGRLRRRGSPRSSGRSAPRCRPRPSTTPARGSRSRARRSRRACRGGRRRCRRGAAAARAAASSAPSTCSRRGGSARRGRRRSSSARRTAGAPRRTVSALLIANPTSRDLRRSRERLEPHELGRRAFLGQPSRLLELTGRRLRQRLAERVEHAAVEAAAVVERGADQLERRPERREQRSCPPPGGAQRTRASPAGSPEAPGPRTGGLPRRSAA